MTSSPQKLTPAQAARADQIIDALARLWPSCFQVFERRRRPLAIGIDQALLVQLEPVIRSRRISETDVRLALARYTGALGYLQNVAIIGNERIDLGGEPAGVVTDRQAAFARRRIAKRKARRQAMNGNSVKRALTVDETAAPISDAAAKRLQDPVRTGAS